MVEAVSLPLEVILPAPALTLTVVLIIRISYINDDNWFKSLLPPPHSVDEMVRQMDAILIWDRAKYVMDRVTYLLYLSIPVTLGYLAFFVVITYVRPIIFTGLAEYILNLSEYLMVIYTGYLINMVITFTFLVNIGRRKYRIAHTIADLDIVWYLTMALVFASSGMALTAVVIQFFNSLGIWILSTPIIIHTKELFTSTREFLPYRAMTIVRAGEAGEKENVD